MVEIRRIRKSDLPALAKMARGIFRDCTLKEQLEIYRFALKNSVDGASLAAANGEKVIGAIFGEKRMPFSSKTAYVRSFVVDKKYLGRGIGTLLMKDLKAMKKAGIKSVSLTVRKNNKKALALYRASGFRDFRLMLLKKFSGRGKT